MTLLQSLTLAALAGAVVAVVALAVYASLLRNEERKEQAKFKRIASACSESKELR